MKIRIVIVLLVLALGMAIPAHAYFEFAVGTRSVQTPIQRPADLPSTASHVLAISDNEEIQRYYYLSSPIPKTELQHFLFADYLPVDEILIPLSERTVSTEFGVADMLYANLKLVELINEYEALQANASAVLEGLAVPYLQKDAADYAGKRVELGRNTISARVETVAGQSQLGASYHLPAFLSLHQGAGNGKNSFKKRIFRQLPTLNRFPPKSFTGGAVHNQTAKSLPETDAADTDQEHRFRYGVDAESEKPWPIKLIIFLIFNNKFLAILFFAAVYIAFWLLFYFSKK